MITQELYKKNLRNSEVFQTVDEIEMVPLVGLEPTRYRYHQILSLARLPVSPQRHIVSQNIQIII